MDRNLFAEYMEDEKSSRADKTAAWLAAIGLQDVDNLQTSSYLIETARKNIEGKLTFSQVDESVLAYYSRIPKTGMAPTRMREADLVSARMAALLFEKDFSLTSDHYLSIHRTLFEGMYPDAGCMRTFNISKQEPVLEGASVSYGIASELAATLEYDLSMEKAFSYRGRSQKQIIHHLAVFIWGLWQIHPFSEGNTRTTAIFLIQYLRSLRFEPIVKVFAQNAGFFRNALVRANFSNPKYGVAETAEFLELFLENLLLKKQNRLDNRMLYIGNGRSAQDK